MHPSARRTIARDGGGRDERKRGGEFCVWESWQRGREGGILGIGAGAREAFWGSARARGRHFGDRRGREGGILGIGAGMTRQ